MLKNYFLIAVRNILKQKGYSFINILGLTIGITCCLLIVLFVADELSFDNYHPDADNLYRVWVDGTVRGDNFAVSNTPPPMAEALLNEIPEIINAVRIKNYGFPVMRSEGKAFSEERFWAVDSNFFDIFSAEFIAGDPRTAIARPFTLVITESTAKRYFGDEDPIGKVMNQDKRQDYTVTGVIKDIPHNTHFHFDFICPLSGWPDSRTTFWLANSFYTYVVLTPDAVPAEVDEKLKAIVEKYVGPAITQNMGMSFDDLKNMGDKFDYRLQKVRDIHLHSNLTPEIEDNSNAIFVYIFSVIALIILVLACINFMNLSTARSANRAREVGIRKTLGSLKSSLMNQFLMESVVMGVIAVIFSFVILYLLLPLYQSLAGRELTVTGHFGIWIFPLALVFGILAGLMAGIYPAFVLASFDPIMVLKGKFASSRKGTNLRSFLVVSQFTISIALTISSLFVMRQLNYIADKDPGWNMENLVIVKKTDDLQQNLQPFKDRILQLPGVISASYGITIPGEQNFNFPHIYQKDEEQENIITWTWRTDYDFAKTWEIEMAEGRFFNENWGADSFNTVINEAAVRAIGWDEPLGKQIFVNGGPLGRQAFTVIGVMKDFHYESLHREINPLSLKIVPPQILNKFTAVRVAPGKVGETITAMESIWREYTSDQAFEYTLMEDLWNSKYRTETITGNLLLAFAGLAVFIACLGLFGLASFTAAKRTREIGIRKVLGATVKGVTGLLCQDVLKLMLISTLISWPIAFFLMKNWQQNFAFNPAFGWWIYIVSSLAALLIALLTVSYQVIKVAMVNPAITLKYE